MLTKRFPDHVDWLINKSEAMREQGDRPGAIQALKDAQDRFAENAEYLFAVGRMHALLGEFMEARKFVRQAIKLDSKFRVEFLEDSAFDGVWESF